MRTRIVATLGPASSDFQTMKEMVENGVRIFRLNFSHSNAEGFRDVAGYARAIEDELGQPLTLMGDLCGPKIRIGDVEGSPLQIDEGQTVWLGLPEYQALEREPYISLDVPELLKGLQVDMPIMLSDGLLQFAVTEVIKPDVLFRMRSNNAGVLTSHKGIAFPGKFHPMPALTNKDRKDLHEALDLGVDALALSFVQTMEDIKDVKREIASHGVWVPVVAKIERESAVNNIDAILQETDAIMVARGDLGLECPIHSLPVIQKKLVRACRHAQKGCIVATQMLLSMVNNPLPTRAETTDVANAIMDGADCMMLSEETAMGVHPAKAVRFMRDIARDAETYYQQRQGEPYAPKPGKSPAKYLAYTACLLADKLSSDAVVCHSTSGTTARLLSSRRAEAPIFALSPNEKVVRYLNFFRSVEPRHSDTSIPTHLERCERFIEEKREFLPGDSTIITCGEHREDQKKISTNLVKVYYKSQKM